jgi:hypothetical protein
VTTELSPLYLRRSELDSDADAHLDELDTQLRAVLSELRLTHDRCLRLEAAFVALRQDVEAALRRAEERYAP